MQSPDDKRHTQRDDAAVSEPLPGVWRKLLAQAVPLAPAEPLVLGFFLDVVPEEGVAYAHVDVAPVLLAMADQTRYVRPTPFDSKHLSQQPLQPHEQRLAATVLGLPQTLRKSRTYARLSGHVGDALLAEILDTTPCFLGGLAGLRLSRGKGHQLNWQWHLENDGSQRLMPCMPANHRVLRIDALWYLDAERAEMGHLDAPLEETSWLDLPALKHEYSQILRDALPGSQIGRAHV